MALCYVKAYYDWIEQMAALSDAEKGRLIIAILEYGRSGMEPELSGRESILFPVFKSQIDRDKKSAVASAENGKKGGRPSKHSETYVNLDEPSETYENLEKGNKDKDKDNNKEKEKDNKIASAFDKFWDAYPKKVGKSAAKSSFSRVKGVNVETMLKAIEIQRRSEQWNIENGRFIPNPATWLNQGRWEDGIVTNGQEEIKRALPTSILKKH